MLYYGIKPKSLGQLGLLGGHIPDCDNGVVKLKVNFLRGQQRLLVPAAKALKKKRDGVLTAYAVIFSLDNV